MLRTIIPTLALLFALTVVIFMAKKIWLERQKRNA